MLYGFFTPSILIQGKPEIIGARTMTSWMDIYVSFFVLAGLVAAFLSQWRILRGDTKRPEEGRGIGQLPPDKRNAFTWAAFFSLTLIGVLIPIVSFASKITPNNPPAEVLFCFFYILGPLMILRWVVVDLEGKLAVNPPYLKLVFLVGCWIFPRKLWRSKVGGSMFVFIVSPILFFAFVLKVSPVLIVSTLPSLAIFSIVFDVVRVHG